MAWAHPKTPPQLFQNFSPDPPLTTSYYIWFKNKNLFISLAKSSATIFPTETSQFNMNLPININGFNVPTIKNPKLLGITFDNGLFFNKHTEQIEKSLRNKNNALKALAGSTWGKEKETLVNTWKAIGSSVMNY